MKRRDLLVGVTAGVGFTVGNACLWQLAESTTQGHKSAGGDASLDEDPLILGEEGIVAPKGVVKRDPELAQYGKKLFKGTVADATDMPELEDLSDAGQVLESPSSGDHAGHSGCCPAESSAEPSMALAHTHPLPDPAPGDAPSLNQRDRILERVRNFDGTFSDDIFLTEAEKPVLHSLFHRFRRAEKLVGHGNYNLLGFDELFRFGRNFSQVGLFTQEELALIEKLFFTEAEKYGFYGEKVTKDLTASINPDDTVKIPASGHFLLRGDSSEYYDQIRRDIGESLILTSGVRGNVKQMHLFVAKCLESHYNLSKASRSLAPPGHSYHGVGDFDVGRVGWGYSNFTDQFAETDEFKRMQDLGYVRIRYTKDNFYGVRFEPWHIKVA